MEGGRLGVYAALGASASAIPLPWVPDALLRQVRGALVHDVATRHGVSLAPEARRLLADPLRPGARRGLIAQAARFVGSTLAVRTLTGFGPAGLLWPAHGMLSTYMLGRLFDRYLEVGRTERAARIDGDEARRVRRAIDLALARAWTTAPKEAAATPPPSPPLDEQRDRTTAAVDAVLEFAAGIPQHLVRRLEAAFDEICFANAHE